MATFVKKDGTPVSQIVAPRRLPEPDENGLVGFIENFEIEHDHSTMERRIRLSLRVNEHEVAKAGGLMPLIATGQRVQIKMVR